MAEAMRVGTFYTGFLEYRSERALSDSNHRAPRTLAIPKVVGAILCRVARCRERIQRSFKLAGIGKKTGSPLF